MLILYVPKSILNCSIIIINSSCSIANTVWAVPCFTADGLEVLILLFHECPLQKELKLLFGLMDLMNSGKLFRLILFDVGLQGLKKMVARLFLVKYYSNSISQD